MVDKAGNKTGGRQTGTPNKRTQELQTVADQAIERGITPLDVMLELMRDYWARAEEAAAVNGSEKKAAASIAEALELREKAGHWATEAAPYVHPKFTAVKIMSTPDAPAIAGAVVPKKDAIGQLPPKKKLAAAT